MKLFAALMIAATAYAQTAIFPGGVVTDNQLGIAANVTRAQLSNSITAAATTINVTNSSCVKAGYSVACTAAFVPNMMLVLDNEAVQICSVTAGAQTTALQVGHSSCPNIDGRGFDGTTAAAHNAAIISSINIAWNHNATNKEVEAIELRSRYVPYVTDYGADPTGMTDSSAAINSCMAFNLYCYIPDQTSGAAGVYRLNSTVTVTGSGKILGCASKLTTLKYFGATTFSAVTFGNGATGTNTNSFLNCFVDGNSLVTGAALYNNQGDSGRFIGVGATNGPIGFLTVNSVAVRVDDYRCNTSSVVTKCLSVGKRSGSSFGSNQTLIVNPGILGNGTGVGISLDAATGTTIIGGYCNSNNIGVDLIQAAALGVGASGTVILNLDIESQTTLAMRNAGDSLYLAGPSVIIGNIEVTGSSHVTNFRDLTLTGGITLDSGANRVSVTGSAFAVPGVYITDNSASGTTSVQGNTLAGVRMEDYANGVYNGFSGALGCVNCIVGGGSNNAITGTYTFTNAVISLAPLFEGQQAVIFLHNSLQVGANTFKFGSDVARSIKRASNPSLDISKVYSSGGVVSLSLHSGTWLMAGE